MQLQVDSCHSDLLRQIPSDVTSCSLNAVNKKGLNKILNESKKHWKKYLNLWIENAEEDVCVCLAAVTMQNGLKYPLENFWFIPHMKYLLSAKGMKGGHLSDAVLSTKEELLSTCMKPLHFLPNSSSNSCKFNCFSSQEVATLQSQNLAEENSDSKLEENL